jgi:para-nitrobenzyl esterase
MAGADYSSRLCGEVAMPSRRTVISTSLGALAAAPSLAGRAVAGDAPVAATAHGKVRGVDDGGIRIFKGIPYAAARRFEAPGAPKPWTEIRDALAFGPMCPQARGPLGSLFASWTFDKDMSEDCQLLNVWTPGLGDGGKRPVMVWLHGGDFTSLSGSRNVFDGTRLARKGDVVVVTLNHRLNVFGYLQLAQLAPQYPDAGNAGMLDIVAALKWVKDNIAAFGGDAGNVTIFGQSGGGGKVSTLMAMPAARGLFHKAIVQSGSYYLQAMSAEEGTRLAVALLEALDMKPGDAAALATVATDRLVDGLGKAMRGPAKANYRPVVDGRNLPAGPWAPEGPALSADIPMIIGTTATEMTLLTGARQPETFTLDEPGLRKRLAEWFGAGDIDKVIATFRATRPGATPSQLFFAVATDKAMREGAWRQAERKARQGAAPVWLYELDWTTPVDGGKWGSPHSLDLAMVFDNVALSESMVGKGPEPQAVADQMSAAWLAFARGGNPNNPRTVVWPAYGLADRATLVFDVKSRVVNDFRGDERTLLASLKPPTN